MRPTLSRSPRTTRLRRLTAIALAISLAAPPVALGASSGTAPGHGPSSSTSGISIAAIVVAAIALLVALAAAALWLARSQAYEPGWTVTLRHSLAEASFRASSTWAEFSDWIRVGR
jgi:hypothetical protein